MRCVLFIKAHLVSIAPLLAAAMHVAACREAPHCLHCDEEVVQDPLLASCGVFASAGARPGGNGTKDSPYSRLQEAIDNAKGNRVCACASQPFAEAVTLRDGIDLLGGFTCEAWTRPPGARSAIRGPAGQVALTLTAEAGGAMVEAFEITAESAEDQLGGSAIAVAVDDIPAQLRQVHVSAGDGKKGRHGEPLTEPATAGRSAPTGGEAGAPNDACSAEPPHGGQPGHNMCGDDETSGGAGAPGGQVSADDRNSVYGQAGTNGLPAMATTGRGGMFNAGWSVEPASAGASRPPGASGAGGHRGPLTLAGFLEGDGAGGEAGQPGQGGGGGVGGHARLRCPESGAPLFAGASGGGGGAGGCGGGGGAGGRAGGSSIGIVSLGTKLILVEVTASVGQASDGGNGAAGQLGGRGGEGAPGGTVADEASWSSNNMGGRGGSGGTGGPGGGGRGGDAIGIAYATCPTTPEAASSLGIRSLGQPGASGAGGDIAQPGQQSHPGERGIRAACWCADTHASCDE
ncbi:hypothetical protein WMF38_48820 [Sorangium sp. So ce118]